MLQFSVALCIMQKNVEVILVPLSGYDNLIYHSISIPRCAMQTIKIRISYFYRVSFVGILC